MYQLTSPGVPTTLDVTGSTSTMVNNFKNDSNENDLIWITHWKEGRERNRSYRVGDKHRELSCTPYPCDPSQWTCDRSNATHSLPYHKTDLDYREYASQVCWDRRLFKKEWVNIHWQVKGLCNWTKSWPSGPRMFILNSRWVPHIWRWQHSDSSKAYNQ